MRNVGEEPREDGSVFCFVGNQFSPRKCSNNSRLDETIPGWMHG